MSHERIQTLEALLRRVQKNAAEPRPRRIPQATDVAAAPAAAPVAAARAEDPASWSMQDLSLDEPRAAAPAARVDARPAARPEPRAAFSEPKAPEPKAPEPLRFAGKSFEPPAPRANKMADTPPVRGFGAMKPAQAPRFGKTQLGLEDQAAKVLQETLKTPAPKPSEPRVNEPMVTNRAPDRAFHEATTAEVPKLDLPPVPPAEEPAAARAGVRDELPTHEVIPALPIVGVAAGEPAAAAPPPATPPREEPIELSISEALPLEPSVADPLPQPPAAAEATPQPQAAPEPDARRFAEPERIAPQAEPEAPQPTLPTPRVQTPEQPAFSTAATDDGPSKFASDPIAPPTKKKSSLLLVVALLVVIVAAGVFAWQRFFSPAAQSQQQKRAPIATATATPTTEATTEPTAAATAEAFPTASGDPAAPTASASAMPSGSAAAGAAGDAPEPPTDPKQLPPTLGYLFVKTPKVGSVNLGGQNAGEVNTWLKVSCNGTKFLNVAKPAGGFFGEGQSVAIKCREATLVSVP